MDSGTLAQAVQEAPADRYEAVETMLENFDSSSLLQINSLIYPIMILAVVFIGVGGWRWRQTRHLRSKPLLTFHQLATSLGVTLGDQWFLARIARRSGLPTPLTLMLCPATMRHHAAQFVQHASPQRRAKVMARTSGIEHHIFREAL